MTVRTVAGDSAAGVVATSVSGAVTGLGVGAGAGAGVCTDTAGMLFRAAQQLNDPFFALGREAAGDEAGEVVVVFARAARVGDLFAPCPKTSSKCCLTCASNRFWICAWCRAASFAPSADPVTSTKWAVAAPPCGSLGLAAGMVPAQTPGYSKCAALFRAPARWSGAPAVLPPGGARRGGHSPGGY
eukprot:SAG31_NODE_7264_length_1738_cov_1.356315_1_plen_186_part_00